MVNDEFSSLQAPQRLVLAARLPDGCTELAPANSSIYWRRRAQSAWDSKPCRGGNAPVHSMSPAVSRRCMAHPADPRRLWAGAAAGGVWATADGGASWRSCWPYWASPNIGALAFDPGDPECDLLRHRRSQHLAGLLSGQRPLPQPRRRRNVGAARRRREPLSCRAASACCCPAGTRTACCTSAV